MLLSRTIALAMAILAPLIAADDDEQDVDITFHKWGTTACSSGPGDEVGDPDKIGRLECYTFNHIFTSFTYESSGIMNKLTSSMDDYIDPTCKVIIYAAEFCQGIGFTPGQIGVAMDKCFEVPEQLARQKGLNITAEGGPWAKSAGVFCGVVANGKSVMANPAFIMPGTAPYTKFPSYLDSEGVLGDLVG